MRVHTVPTLGRVRPRRLTQHLQRLYTAVLLVDLAVDALKRHHETQHGDAPVGPRSPKA